MLDFFGYSEFFTGEPVEDPSKNVREKNKNTIEMNMKYLYESEEVTTLLVDNPVYNLMTPKIGKAF